MSGGDVGDSSGGTSPFSIHEASRCLCVRIFIVHQCWREEAERGDRLRRFASLIISCPLGYSSVFCFVYLDSFTCFLNEKKSTVTEHLINKKRRKLGKKAYYQRASENTRGRKRKKTIRGGKCGKRQVMRERQGKWKTKSWRLLSACLVRLFLTLFLSISVPLLSSEVFLLSVFLLVMCIFISCFNLNGYSTLLTFYCTFDCLFGPENLVSSKRHFHLFLRPFHFSFCHSLSTHTYTGTVFTAIFKSLTRMGT